MTCLSIASSPDGSLWVAWLSFDGSADDIAIRHRRVDGSWQNLQWVPGSDGDNWAPQVSVDGANRVWVVWSRQVEGNWDIYARRFDPEQSRWSQLEQLSSDPLPDIHPRIGSDGHGGAALVWQGFRTTEESTSSNIFLRVLKGDGWAEAVQVTRNAANDWEPGGSCGLRGNRVDRLRLLPAGQLRRVSGPRRRWRGRRVRHPRGRDSAIRGPGVRCSGCRRASLDHLGTRSFQLGQGPGANPAGLVHRQHSGFPPERPRLPFIREAAGRNQRSPSRTHSITPTPIIPGSFQMDPDRCGLWL